MQPYSVQNVERQTFNKTTDSVRETARSSRPPGLIQVLRLRAMPTSSRSVLKAREKGSDITHSSKHLSRAERRLQQRRNQPKLASLWRVAALDARHPCQPLSVIFQYPHAGAHESRPAPKPRASHRQSGRKPTQLPFSGAEDRVTPATSLERRRSLLIDSTRPRPVQARERVGVINTDCLPHTTYVEILRACRQRIPVPPDTGLVR